MAGASKRCLTEAGKQLSLLDMIALQIFLGLATAAQNIDQAGHSNISLLLLPASEKSEAYQAASSIRRSHENEEV